MKHIQVYHGSKNYFHEFDYDKIGINGTSEGKGFYFTDKKGVAQSYAGEGGYLYHIILHAKNPIIAYKRNITQNDLHKLMNEIHKREEYYSNWGEIDYEGYDKVVNRALDTYESMDDDVDIISSLANECGSIELVNRVVYELLGYDVIIDNQPEWGKGQTIYVALVKDTIEIKQVEKLK